MRPDSLHLNKCTNVHLCQTCHCQVRRPPNFVSLTFTNPQPSRVVRLQYRSIEMVAAFVTPIQICSGPSLKISFVYFSLIPVPPKTQNPAKTLIFRPLKSAQIRPNPVFRVRLIRLIRSERSGLVLWSQVHSLHLAARTVKTCSVERTKNARDSEAVLAMFHLQSVSTLPPGLVKAQRLESTSQKRPKIREFLTIG